MPKPSPNAEVTLVGCPACSGVLSLIQDGSRGHVQYVCSIGHAFSLQGVLQAKEDQVEHALWSVVSLLEHVEMICQQFLDHVDRTRASVDRRPIEARIRQAREHRKLIRDVIERENPAALVKAVPSEETTP